MKICPLCSKGFLEEKSELNEILTNISITLHYSVCTYCLSEQANSEQLCKNKEEMQQFWKMN